MEHLMTTHEAADFLRVHKCTLYRMIYRDQVPAIRIAGVWRFRLEELEQWCATRTIECK
jgi:excisionase family DNA binding protein